MSSHHMEDGHNFAYASDPLTLSPAAVNDEKRLKAERMATRAKKNQDALARGAVVPPRSAWTGNPGAPVPPLVRTTNPTRLGDRPCENCGGYHLDSTNGPTKWFLCPMPWDATCVEKNAKYMAKKAYPRAPSAGGKAATIAATRETTPEAAAEPATPQYSAGEHAAAMAFRAESRYHFGAASQPPHYQPPHYQTYYAHQQPPQSQWSQSSAQHGRYDTNSQGWVAPWTGQVDHNTFMFNATSAPEEVHQPIDHLVAKDYSGPTCRLLHQASVPHGPSLQH